MRWKALGMPHVELWPSGGNPVLNGCFASPDPEQVCSLGVHLINLKTAEDVERWMLRKAILELTDTIEQTRHLRIGARPAIGNEAKACRSVAGSHVGYHRAYAFVAGGWLTATRDHPFWRELLPEIAAARLRGDI